MAPFTEISADGRWLAATTARHELGVLDLATPAGSFTVYSNNASDGFAWSPNSTRLAYVEQLPNHPSMLWVLDPRSGRSAEPLLADPAWKASPVWLTYR